MGQKLKYRCSECFKCYDDYEIKSDSLFCPVCGGYLEEVDFKESEKERGSREEKQQHDNFDHQGKDYAPKKRLHTHYDNLKVARNAPPEVIRAAYRVLAQKYHPDRNPGNSEAARIMKIINTSYNVLSDPEARREHDLWIAQREQPATEQPRHAQTDYQQARPSTSRSSTPPTKSPTANSKNGFISHILKYWFLYLIGGAIFWSNVNNKPQPGPKPYQAPQVPDRPTFSQPYAAPNGQPWPISASYMSGYPRLHTSGLSKVTVDNSKNDSAVFVKLVSLSGAKAYPVRTFYIPAYGRFTLNSIDAGSYDIRYRNLRTGSLSRSQAFDLEEKPTYDGTQYSNMTLTLYKVVNGNMHTYALSEEEF